MRVKDIRRDAHEEGKEAADRAGLRCAANPSCRNWLSGRAIVRTPRLIRDREPWLQPSRRCRQGINDSPRDLRDEPAIVTVNRGCGARAGGML